LSLGDTCYENTRPRTGQGDKTELDAREGGATSDRLFYGFARFYDIDRNFSYCSLLLLLFFILVVLLLSMPPAVALKRPRALPLAGKINETCLGRDFCRCCRDNIDAIFSNSDDLSRDTNMKLTLNAILGIPQEKLFLGFLFPIFIHPLLSVTS